MTKPKEKRAKPEQFSFGLIVTDPQAFRMKSQQRTRRCLSCARDFDSEGPGNRICGLCKQRSTWSSPADFSLSTAAF
jgi:hypothetical protein